MTDEEIRFLEALAQRGPIPEAQLADQGWSELAVNLQRRGLCQRDVVTNEVALTHLGWMEVPRPHFYRLRAP